MDVADTCLTHAALAVTVSTWRTRGDTPPSYNVIRMAKGEADITFRSLVGSDVIQRYSMEGRERRYERIEKGRDMGTSVEVDSKAQMVNGLGIVLIVIGWIGFGFLLAIEIWYIADLISREVAIFSAVQSLATLEILWIGFLALAGFGYTMRLLAAYTRERAQL